LTNDDLLHKKVVVESHIAPDDHPAFQHFANNWSILPFALADRNARFQFGAILTHPAVSKRVSGGNAAPPRSTDRESEKMRILGFSPSHRWSQGCGRFRTSHLGQEIGGVSVAREIDFDSKTRF
jgi:hypothetical protein